MKSIKEIGFYKQIVRYLNTICSDSGECLAFGCEQKETKKVFADFIDLRHLKSVKKVGHPSANGFVLNLQYEAMNYKANALFDKKTSDKLFLNILQG